MSDERLRYAIWLEPAASASRQIEAVMQELQERYHGPVFAPHLTLTSGILGEPAALLARLASELATCPRFSLQVHELAIRGDDHFRAVVLNTDTPPTLAQLRRRVRRTFGLDPETAYEPHLSLLYGHLSGEQIQAIRERLATERWPPLPITACSLWRLQGEVADWRMVDRVGLADEPGSGETGGATA